jgi:hypothetical protein
MTRLRKLRPTIRITLVVYLFVVGSGTAMARRCCYLHSIQGMHSADVCSRFHAHARNHAVHDHNPVSKYSAAMDRQCHCLILPTGTVNSSINTFEAAEFSRCIHGAAYAPCLTGLTLDSQATNGGRHPPRLSDFKPVSESLQTVSLLI